MLDMPSRRAVTRAELSPSGALDRSVGASRGWQVAGLLLGLLACRAAPAPEAPPKRDAEATAPQVPEAPVSSTSASPQSEPKAVPLTETERVAVETACKELNNTYKHVRCEATHRFEEFIVLRAFREVSEGHVASWYVLQSVDGKRTLLTSTETLRGGSDVTELDRVCATDAAGTEVPAGSGLLRAEIRDLDLDGRGDLLLECRKLLSSPFEQERRYLRYCESDRQVCEEEIMMRHVVEGEVELDVAVEFIDGWFVRTVRAAKSGRQYDNIKVTDKPIPDPRPR